MQDGQARPFAVCVIRRNGDIFVAEHRDPAAGRVFYQPIGSGIEPGEHGEDAAARAVREEIGTEAINMRYLGAIENAMTSAGAPQHEVVLVYSGTFADKSLYEMAGVDAYGDGTLLLKAMWKPLAEFAVGPTELYPEGLLELLLTSDGAIIGFGPRPRD